MSHAVTKRDDKSQNVTKCHDQSRDVTNVTTRLEETRLDKKAADGRAGTRIAKPRPKPGPGRPVSAQQRLIGELGDMLAANDGIEQVHVDLGRCLAAVPRFAACLPGGPRLRALLQDMLRSYDGLGSGPPLPQQFIEMAVNETAKKLKPDHTDEQAIRNVLASRLRFKASDWRKERNQAAVTGAPARPGAQYGMHKLS